MKKLLLSSVISTTMAAPALASPMIYFNQVSSGTASDPLASFSPTGQAPLTREMWYVDPASGTASNIATPAVRIVTAATWSFDFSNPALVPFLGKFVLGSYRVQQRDIAHLTPPIDVDGRLTYHDVVVELSGVGSYNEATNTFSYAFLNPVAFGGGASNISESAAGSCVNGRTSFVMKTCSWYASRANEWEGLALDFVFTEDKSSFNGSMVATEIGGPTNGATTAINWTISEVPVPPTAWLFGSGLLALAARKRRATP